MLRNVDFKEGDIYFYHMRYSGYPKKETIGKCILEKNKGVWRLCDKKKVIKVFRTTQTYFALGYNFLLSNKMRVTLYDNELEMYMKLYRCYREDELGQENTIIQYVCDINKSKDRLKELSKLTGNVIVKINKIKGIK